MGAGEERRREAFERLFRDTRTDLLAYVLRRSGTAEDAADVFAETYLIAWQKLDAIPGGDQGRPSLFGVARNLLLKARNRHRSDNALVQRLASELRGARPAHPPVDHERRDALRAALTALPEIDREILTLTAWEGLTPNQIATVIARSPNIVRVRLHRARARLRRQLTPARSVEPRAECVAVKPDWQRTGIR